MSLIHVCKEEARKLGSKYLFYSIGGNVIFKTISYLKFGNEVQRRAYDVINELNIMEDLCKYTPVLCGTIPISIDIKGSDLDIIMEAHDFNIYKEEVKKLYQKFDRFVIRETSVNNIPSVISNFHYKGFDFELFAQPVAVEIQNAYRHMLIEHHLLLANPRIRQEIITLKESGMKTEAAFAKVFKLEGDPYEELLIHGAQRGIL